MIAFRHIKKLVKDSLYCSVATVQNGIPHCSPIGSVYLNNEQQGYYLEMFTTSVKKSKAENDTGCIMVVNTSLWFWFKSLLRGQFKTPPAVRLVVKFGDRRASSEIEEQRFRKRVKLFKGLKGHKIMWSKTAHVRDFTIEKVIPVSIGKMTSADYTN